MKQRRYLIYFIGFLIFLAAGTTIGSAGLVLPDYNNIFLHVANDAGVKYNVFSNNTYRVWFDGPGKGQNAMHISDSYTAPSGKIISTTDQSGYFYVTDTGGKGYEDDVILMLAVNGTVPDDFAVHITSGGCNWTPVWAEPGRNAALPDISAVHYVEGAVDETFTKSDFIYGPQTWRPNADPGCPLYDGQDMSDTGNTFSIMFIDTKVGLLSGLSGVPENGMVKVEYSFENLHSLAAFDAYGWCGSSNNGYNMIAWTNRLMGSGEYSGYSVTGVPSSGPTPVIIPGQPGIPTDPDHDGIYEDLNGNGRKDFNDVFVFFKQMSWISASEPISLFDFNNNGRIDFNDIFLMFKEI